jgi:hypothetical protein
VAASMRHCLASLISLNKVPPHCRRSIPCLLLRQTQVQGPLQMQYICFATPVTKQYTGAASVLATTTITELNLVALSLWILKASRNRHRGLQA